MGRKDWVNGDLMEGAEVGTLGHLLCVIFQLGKATGMEASFGRGAVPLLWCQLHGTLLLRSRQYHPLLKGYCAQSTSSMQLTSSVPFSHP